ncbi:MAG: glutamate--tRNA ligase, partial [Acidobacteria bacterium]|nr:glutamate--tRNA ligase [Acidobacteriota bacterium]
MEELLPRVEKELRAHELWHADYEGPRRDWLRRTVELLQPRMRTLEDVSGISRAYFSDEVDYDPAAEKKFWKDATLAVLLPELAGELAGELEKGSSLDAAAAEQGLRSFAERKQVKAGLLINASRLALTGQAVAPSLFDVMEVMGRERVVARLKRAGEYLAARTVP